MKKTPDVDVDERRGSPTPPASTSRESQDDPSTSSTTHQGDWFLNYQIPWDEMSKTFITTLNQGQRPSASQRREMVRFIISDIKKICEEPKRKQLEKVASAIVRKYPVAFKDTFCDRLVGSGYESILNSLCERAHNSNRGKKAKRGEKRQNSGDPSTKSTCPDSYGCINFNPPKLSTSETEAQEEKKQEMKKAFQTGKQESTVLDLMKATYATQRSDILKEGMTMYELTEGWPYLFQSGGMMTHFEELVGVNLKPTVEKSYESKGKLILEFMQTKTNGNKDLQATLSRIERAKGRVGNQSPDIPGLMLLIMNFFKEGHDELFQMMEVSFY